MPEPSSKSEQSAHRAESSQIHEFQSPAESAALDDTAAKTLNAQSDSDGIAASLDTPTSAAGPLCLQQPSKTFPGSLDVDWSLLSYYTDNLAELLLNTGGIRNPLQHLIIPRLDAHPFLLHAVCAVSSLHQSQINHASRAHLQSQATLYYVKTLSSLQRLIPGLMRARCNQTTHDSSMIDGVLLTTVLLCKFEIIKDGLTNWRQHLKGIASLCSLFDLGARAATDETMAFIRSL